MADIHYIALVCGAGLTALGKFGPEWIGLYPTIWIIAAWICAGVSAAVAVRSQNGPTEIHELGATILMGPIVWVVAVLSIRV